MKLKFILIILCILINLHYISSLGVTPGRTTINFEPGLHKTISFSILNTEHKDVSLSISVRGDLAKYVKLSANHAEFSSSEDSKQFSYDVSLPEDLTPGIHEAEIVISEIPAGEKQGETFVGASVGAITQLHVYSPYPDKYVEVDMNVIDSGKTVSFSVPVFNRGKLDINNIKTTIDIYSGSDKIDTIESESISLKSMKRHEFLVKLDKELSSGTYRAVANVSYDGKTATKETEFNIGELALEVLEINVKDFQLGGVAKVNALVQNNWKEDLKNVFMNIVVYYQNGSVMADIRSAPYDVNALEKINMISYWDTEGVAEGTYDSDIILKYGTYGEKSIRNKVKIKVSEDALEFIGLTGHVVAKGGKANITKLLIIIIIVLVLGNLLWFVVYKRLKKK